MGRPSRTARSSESTFGDQLPLFPEDDPIPDAHALPASPNALTATRPWIDPAIERHSSHCFQAILWAASALRRTPSDGVFARFHDPPVIVLDTRAVTVAAAADALARAIPVGRWPIPDELAARVLTDLLRRAPIAPAKSSAKSERADIVSPIASTSAPNSAKARAKALALAALADFDAQND